MMHYRMRLLRGRDRFGRLRWRGTGYSLAPGSLTQISHERRWSFTWEWPTGPMSWFFWNWQPTVFAGRLWRIGPLTLSIVPPWWEDIAVPRA